MTDMPPIEASASTRSYEEINSRLGMTPLQFRRFGRGVTIIYGCAPCSLGTMLVAMTDRGVCAITFGDTPSELEKALRERFSAANLERGDKTFLTILALVVSHIDKSSSAFPLPLDVQATAFQAKVWEFLRTIPRGTTVSYTEIAEKIGCPKGARAVARACASNPVAVAIPCHRVVGKDGNLTGYRWGTERKKVLLAEEATANQL